MHVVLVRPLQMGQYMTTECSPEPVPAGEASIPPDMGGCSPCGVALGGVVVGVVLNHAIDVVCDISGRV